MSSGRSPRLWRPLRAWWCARIKELGRGKAAVMLAQSLWHFALESTPARRRQRYGDMDYDWEHRVNTTSGTTDWRTRLLGLFHSPYQPTEPALFHEMMAALPIQFEPFIFVDLGSGKGRTLLLAADYPFKKIVGVELLSELHRSAESNIRDYHNPTQRCHSIEAILADARDFELPKDPLVLYLFNPLPPRALAEVMQRLQKSLAESPRPLWIVYHNPMHQTILESVNFLIRVGGTLQYSLYRATAPRQDAHNRSLQPPSDS